MVEEIMNTTPEENLTNDDKLWGMLSWLPFVGWILAIIALIIEPQKDSTYIRTHAIQSLAANVVLGILSIILGFTVVLSCVAPFLSLVLIYPAIKAYQGEKIQIIWLTDFCKDQGWI
ncbi:MAG: hypothetical protein U9O54_00780 [Chloroflexota bacterium]|nr:hypothetical protein [Chloroflexota bacterium]